MYESILYTSEVRFKPCNSEPITFSWTWRNKSHFSQLYHSAYMNLKVNNSQPSYYEGPCSIERDLVRHKISLGRLIASWNGSVELAFLLGISTHFVASYYWMNTMNQRNHIIVWIRRSSSYNIINGIKIDVSWGIGTYLEKEIVSFT